MEFVSLFMSVVSLTVAGFSFYNAVSTRRDTARSQMIRDAYLTFYELNRLQLQNWQLSHLFAMPDLYARISIEVANWKSLSSEERSELLLKERAIALLIFTIYEQSFYQWKQSRDAGDVRRAGFLSEVLGYFTGRVLRNPRLLYYWCAEGDGLAAYFETETRKHYGDNVVNDTKAPLVIKPDFIGPFKGSANAQSEAA
jgi:hypothetical protein